MGCVQKSKDGSTVRPDLLVNDPAFLVVVLTFVVWFLGVLGERVADALVKNVFGVIWP